MKAISAITALASALTLCYSAQSLAAVDKRWFEVEVILFSQLGDKAKLNETFSGESSLPRYRKVIDLLTPYLYPDTKSLYLQLPSCEDNSYSPFLVDSQATIPPMYVEKSLEEIAALTLIEEATERATEQATTDNVDGAADDKTDGTTSATSAYGISQQQNAASGEVTENDSSSELTPAGQSFEAQTELTELAQQAIVTALTEEEQQLISQAEQAFSTPELTFNYTDIATYQQTLCQPFVFTEQSTLNNYAEFIWQYKPTKYSVEEMSTHIDGNEFIYTDEPYLIDADSLQLKDITLQLRRSKNFKPILHVGWRQPLTNRRKPEREPAIRLMAGKHYFKEYQTQLEAFEQQTLMQALAKQQTAILESGNDHDDIASAAIESSDVSPISQRLQRIYQTLDDNNISLESTMAELDSPELTLDADVANAELVNGEVTPLTAPNKPNQDWWLDGYFRLHLNHYLFITTDFNVAVPFEQTTQEEIKTEEQQPFTFKLIPFSQNKRVISKEVHYFDHPYMGMIVQIRRYKKPEPPAPKQTDEIPTEN